MLYYIILYQIMVGWGVGFRVSSCLVTGLCSKLGRTSDFELWGLTGIIIRIILGLHRGNTGLFRGNTGLYRGNIGLYRGTGKENGNQSAL